MLLGLLVHQAQRTAQHVPGEHQAPVAIGARCPGPAGGLQHLLHRQREGAGAAVGPQPGLAGDGLLDVAAELLLHLQRLRGQHAWRHEHQEVRGHAVHEPPELRVIPPQSRALAGTRDARLRQPEPVEELLEHPLFLWRALHLKEAQRGLHGLQLRPEHAPGREPPAGSARLRRAHEPLVRMRRGAGRHRDSSSGVKVPMRLQARQGPGPLLNRTGEGAAAAAPAPAGPRRAPPPPLLHAWSRPSR